MAQGEIWKVTNESIQAGKRAKIITAMDEGACVALLQLAERLDGEDWPVVFQSYYFKACEQLGLTPSGRKTLDLKKEAGGGKLAELRAIQGGAAGRGRKRSG